MTGDAQLKSNAATEAYNTAKVLAAEVEGGSTARMGDLEAALSKARPPRLRLELCRGARRFLTSIGADSLRGRSSPCFFFWEQAPSWMCASPFAVPRQSMPLSRQPICSAPRQAQEAVLAEATVRDVLASMWEGIGRTLAAKKDEVKAREAKISEQLRIVREQGSQPASGPSHALPPAAAVGASYHQQPVAGEEEYDPLAEGRHLFATRHRPDSAARPPQASVSFLLRSRIRG